MKYLKQFFIILAVSFLGEFLGQILPLPVPGSIYGLVILFVCLLTGVIKVADVKETSHFLLDIMPCLFIPAAVGIMEQWGIIRGSLPAYAAIILVTTVCVMAVSGRVTQAFMKKENRSSRNSEAADPGKGGGKDE